MLAVVIISVIIIQRLIELLIAKRNEIWMRERGAYEAGASHYPWMVAMHVAFFGSLIVEIVVAQRGLSTLWILLLFIFMSAQVGRFWCLFSLGKFWNTKIIILPGANVVRKGPYRWIRHPNYLLVSIELLTLPLLFNAYATAIIFFILNIGILSIRIRTEERALKEETDYVEKFSL